MNFKKIFFVFILLFVIPFFALNFYFLDVSFFVFSSISLDILALFIFLICFFYQKTKKQKSDFLKKVKKTIVAYFNDQSILNNISKIELKYFGTKTVVVELSFKSASFFIKKNIDSINQIALVLSKNLNKRIKIKFKENFF